MNCKFRPDSAVKKLKKWTDEMRDSFGLCSFKDDIFGSLQDDGQGSDEAWNEIAPLFTAYAGTGEDNQGRSIMWIKARQTKIEEETNSVRAGVLYFMAVHADILSLRQGITFVIDTTNREMTNVGNEKKLQKVYQSIPLRPQNIFIIGTSFFKRILINALIRFASLFTSDKVIDRVSFATLDEVKQEVSSESLPVYLEGKGGGKATNEQLVTWVRSRLLQFPKFPELD